MNEIDWGIEYVNDHYGSADRNFMNEYIVTITPRGETEPVVGCIVSSGYDPRSAWGRYRFFGQMSQDAGQVTVWTGSHGEKETVVAKWTGREGFREWDDEEPDAPHDIA